MALRPQQVRVMRRSWLVTRHDTLPQPVRPPHVAAAAETLPQENRPARRPGGLAAALAVGGVAGLAWAAGFRGLMAEVAGPESAVHWSLTFGWLLLPGTIVGVLLGWAEHLRTTGGRRGWRWLALAPLVFAGVLFSQPRNLTGLLEDGVGGGALAVPLFGMAGGYALSGRGPRWARITTGLIALMPVPIWAMTAVSVGGSDLAVTTPRGAWVAVYLYSFLALLAFACAIPHRAASAHNES